MKLGSHNSFTYLPVKTWLLKPFSFLARCQDDDINTQLDLGVRLFDLRVRFYNGSPIICHGFIRFGTTKSITEILSELDYFAKNELIYCRVLLEQNFKSLFSQIKQDILFKGFCNQIIKKYPNIKFVGGTRKFDGKIIYEFNNKLPKLINRYSSTTSWFSSKNKFLAILDDWYPRLYAKFHNKDSYKLLNEDSYLFIDFVSIK